MAAKAKRVWVAALGRGQRPDGAWVDENSSPFRIDPDLVSKAWMRKLTDDESKAQDEMAAAAAKADKTGGASAEDATALRDEIVSLTKERDGLKDALEAMTKERDGLKAPPAKSLLGSEQGNKA